MKWIGSSLSANNYVNCKQRLQDVIERCRGTGLEVSSKEEDVLLTDLKKEFEKSLTIQLSDEKLTRFTIPVKRALRLPGDTTQAASTPAPSPGH